MVRERKTMAVSDVVPEEDPVMWPNTEEVVGGVSEISQDANLPGLDDDLDLEMQN